MRSRRPSIEHQQAVSQRLALLGAELAAARPSGPPPAPPPTQPLSPPAPLSRAAAATARRPESSLGEQPWWEQHTRVRRDPAPSEDLRDPDGHEPVDPPVARDLPPEWEPPGAVAQERRAWPATEHQGDPALAPPAVPAPGRHAARRGPRATAQLLPETLRGHVALGPGQLTTVAILVAIGLAVTCWWVVRGDPEQVAPVAAGPHPGAAVVPLTPAAGTPLPSSDAGASGTTDGSGGDHSGTVTVDVAGKVRRPGIAVLPLGARVVDALEAAGGARPGVDLTGLNLARVLVDGEQVLVGVAPAAVAASSAGPAGGPAPAGALLDLNTATATELEALPQVGPVTAQAIVAWREEHGAFTAVDELLEVDGIGDATLEQIAPHVTV